MMNNRNKTYKVENILGNTTKKAFILKASF